jgi:hypothetical protein
MNSNEQIYKDAKTRVEFLLSQNLRGKVEREIEFALRAEGITRARTTILAGTPGRLRIEAPGQEKLLCEVLRFWCVALISVSATPENLVEFLARARGWRPYQLQ